MIDLDDTDRAILRELVRDGSQSAGAVGRTLGLSQPAAWRRIRRLEEAGVIAGRRLDLDAEALGFGVTVFLGVKLAAKGRVSLEDFERAATAIPEVQTVQHVLGLFDYRLRVTARDIAEHLKSEHATFEHKQVVLDEAIKQLGVYSVPVKLHSAVEVMAKVWVVKG